MGWRGVARTLVASSNRASRDWERHQRVRQKERALQHAADTVEAFEDYIQKITSFHRELSTESIDWKSLSQTTAPEKAVNNKARELRIKSYHQKFDAKLFKKLRLDQWTKLLLEKLVRWAQRKDLEEYNALLVQYEVDYNAWRTSRDLAKKVCAGEPQAFTNAVDAYIDFISIDGLGASLAMRHDGKNFDIVINVHGDDIVPKEIIALTPTGKLTKKPMPQIRFNEIYQDYVCSCMLRIAGEVLRLLPLESCTISANDKILNPKNGHLEEQTICSAFIVSKTFSSLNMNALDASEGMSNFIHNMKFKKSSGFEPVEKVNAPSQKK